MSGTYETQILLPTMESKLSQFEWMVPSQIVSLRKELQAETRKFTDPMISVGWW
jgi:hypothetical protein